MPGQTAPFRADHVGSLLRPPELQKARAAVAAGEMTREALTEVEDRVIPSAIKLQEEIGLKGITDGEYRRAFFHTDFLEQIGGVEMAPSQVATHFRRASGEELSLTPPGLKVIGKLHRTHPMMGRDFDFVKSHTTRTPKITIPSPSMAHFRGGRGAVDATAYPNIEDFFTDLAAVYAEEIADLAARGCRYLQMDDTNLAYLCDDTFRERARAMGEDPAQLPSTYARLINRSFAGAPADMVRAVHLCRGNFRSAFVAEGGYEPVAEALFNEIDVNAFFLEYDDDRSGDFSPLRFVPKGKFVVLGVISSKVPTLESVDEVKRRIDSAAKLVPIEQLCLSPQCGFSSTEHGNDVTYDDQRRKLELVVKVAREVWGEI